EAGKAESEEEAGGDVIVGRCAFNQLDARNQFESVQPAASSYCELAASQASSACSKALAAPARALLSWAACFGSRLNKSGSASAVSILAMMPLMRAISASAFEIFCFSGTRFSAVLRCGLSRLLLRSLLPRSRELARAPRADNT